MNQLEILIKKLERLIGSNSIGKIEKDLSLQYLREMYDLVSEIEIKKEVIDSEIPLEIIEDEKDNQSINELELIPEPNELSNLEEKVHLEAIEEINLEAPQSGFDETNELANDNNNENDVEFKELIESIDLINQEIEPPIEFNTEKKEIEVNKVKSTLDFKVWNKDIRTYISINDKYNFISELFQTNQEAYDEILNELNLCENEMEAKQFLENSGITTLYKWEQEGSSELIFYDILSQFFNSK
jgi:hypothetical protein